MSDTMSDFDSTVNVPGGGQNPQPGGYPGSGQDGIQFTQQGGYPPQQNGYQAPPQGGYGAPPRNDYYQQNDYFRSYQNENGYYGQEPTQPQGGGNNNKRMIIIAAALGAAVLVIAGVLVAVLISHNKKNDEDGTTEAESTEQAEDAAEITVPDPGMLVTEPEGTYPTEVMVPLTDPTAPQTVPLTTGAVCPVVLVPGREYMINYDTDGHGGQFLRAGPGSSYAKLATIPEGGIVVFTGQRHNDYISVDYFGTGKRLSGYVWTQHLTENTSGRRASQPVVTVPPVTSPPVTAPPRTTAKPTAPRTTAKPTAPPTTKPTAPPTEPAPSGTSGIVSYFNDAYSRIYTDADYAVLEWREITNSPSVLEVGSSGGGAARFALSWVLNRLDKQPYERVSPVNVPPAGYSTCSLAAYNVASATCRDNGSTYEIHIKLNTSRSNPENNPSPGSSGVGAITDVLVLSDITEMVSDVATVQSFSNQYFETELTATVEKSTKHITRLSTISPSIITLSGVDIDVSVYSVTIADARVGLTYEKRYAIYY